MALNAGGIKGAKYGTTKNYVLGLTVVLPDGRIMNTGSKTMKSVSGYDLCRLFVGSEGTLGIISKVTLKLAGLPEGRRQSAFVFADDVSAARAVSEMMRYGLDVAAIEFLDRQLTIALNRLKGYGLTQAPMLFLEFHGPEPVLESNAELAASICEELGAQPLILTDGQRPWEIRHWATEAVKHFLPGKKILRNDVAFPISHLPDMVAYCHELGEEQNIPIFAFGHVGMGLLHALMLADPNDAAEWDRAHDINTRIIEKTISLGGTISGEHGIGVGHKDLFAKEHGPAVELMRQIKRQFDPHGILNPGKIFDM